MGASRGASASYDVVGQSLRQYGSPVKVSEDNNLIQQVHPPTNIRTLGLIACAICYLFVGAAIFDYLESENEEKEREKLLAAESLLVDVKYKVSEEDKALLQNTYVKLVPYRAGFQWRFAGSLFFAITVITTIGYGHSTPSTTCGRLFCMAYAFVGIPLSLIVYQAVGDRLNYIIKNLTNHIRRQLLGHRIDTSIKNHETEQHIVTACNWCLVALVMLGGAAIFAYYEGWSYFNSIYYCFVTITTIGFGDFVVLQKEGALEKDPFYIALCILYIMVSLCVVASALNLLVLKYLTMNTKDERRAAEAAFVNSYVNMSNRIEKSPYKVRPTVHLNGLT